jgi:hypothetical protein
MVEGHLLPKEAIMLAFPEIRVGEPIRYESLSIFPLIGGADGRVNYLLADEAIAAGSIAVEEIGEAGSVPELAVTNQADELVLFLEGEELKGAKQNRVLNTSVLIAARSKTKIPVSCVEHGRWRYSTRQFAASGMHSSPKLRQVLQKSVLASAEAGRGHRSDQAAVWAEVGRQAKSHSACSDTGAMSDTYLKRQEQFAEYQSRLKFVGDAVGMAVAVGDRIVSLDVFDKPATCRKVWDRILTGAIMDGLETKPAEKPVEKAVAEQVLAALRSSAWEEMPAAGVGAEYRFADGDKHASALVYDGSLVHGSLVML